MIDMDEINSFLEEAVAKYEKTAPTVSSYLDDLYIRIADGKPVLLREIILVSGLQENGAWESPNYAANRVYKIQSELGQDTTGHVGF